ncbi:MAG: Tad domain-containing protein [Elusimicrobiota bacterium]
MNNKRMYTRGQILPYFIALFLAGFIMFALMVNLGIVLVERVKLQSAADAVAQSVACIRARALNMLGMNNAMLGLVLTHTNFAWVPGLTCYDTAGIVEALAGNTELIQRGYGEAYPLLVAEDIAKRNGAESVFIDPFSVLLGFAPRKERVVTFWSTGNLFGVTIPMLPMIQKKVKTFLVWPSKPSSGGNHTVKVYLTKTIPPEKLLFGSKFMPEGKVTLNAVAAARVYNRDGKMFLTDNNSWGVVHTWEYMKAMLGGWDAQIVPVSIPLVMH